MPISEDFKKSLTPIEGKKGLYRDERGHLHYLFSPSTPKGLAPTDRPTAQYPYRNRPFGPEPGDKVRWVDYNLYGIVVPCLYESRSSSLTFVTKPENISPQYTPIPTSFKPDRDCAYPHSVTAVRNLDYLEKFPWE